MPRIEEIQEIAKIREAAVRGQGKGQGLINTYFIRNLIFYGKNPRKKNDGGVKTV